VNRVDKLGREEYVSSPPPKNAIPSGIQECQIACVMCHNIIPAKILVNTDRYEDGIQGVVNFLYENGVAHICDSCYKKMGMVAGPLR
jgi:hypothetical protein